ncbi:MAG TPA: GAF domain-containing protein, partial [Terriglobales bacterium]|nr:GAF domain-containing protein [Terriglobales bacterium]
MRVRKETEKSEPASGDFQDLLLRLSTASGEGRAFTELIRLFCKESREYFAVDGVYYWKLLDGEQLVSVDADGYEAERFRTASLRLSDPAVAVEAVKSCRTVYVNHVDPERYLMAGDYKAAALMAAPLIVAGEVTGAIVFLSREMADLFNEDLAAKGTILASHLGNLIETLERSERHRKRADDLMALALELSASLRLPEFARSFTERVTAMLGAQAAALALSQGSKLETIVLYEGGTASGKGEVRRLNAALGDLASQHAAGLVQGDAGRLLGPGLAASLGWQDLAVVRLTGADNELLGLLCLANLGGTLSDPDRNLLHAVAAHASVALENSRLFS